MLINYSFYIMYKGYNNILYYNVNILKDKQIKSHIFHLILTETREKKKKET